MNRVVDVSTEIAGPPDRIWPFVSTSAGLSSWFVDATIVPGMLGRVTLRFGPGAEGTMPIQIWQPPHRFRFGAAEGAPGRAHDIQLTATSSGATLVRLVDSDAPALELDATREGWQSMLALLKKQAESGITTGM